VVPTADMQLRVERTNLKLHGYPSATPQRHPPTSMRVRSDSEVRRPARQRLRGVGL
jgi:hypothetical protein